MERKIATYFGSTRIGLAKSKSCRPCLIDVVWHGTLFWIKLDHIISHILHLNSPGNPYGIIFRNTVVIRDEV